MKRKTHRKQWIAAVLSASFLFCPICSYADAEAPEKTDIQFLHAYGIMHGDPDGNFRPDDFITRAEATALVYRLYQTKAVNPAVLSVAFADMHDHWATKEVSAAAAVGLVDGAENGTFEPNNIVTLQDFLKMTVSLLGYTPQAERTGYPVGYMIVSANLGLTKGIDSAADAPVTRCMAAQILVNAMDVPLMKSVETESETIYVILDGTDDSPIETLRLALEAK